MVVAGSCWHIFVIANEVANDVVPDKKPINKLAVFIKNIIKTTLLISQLVACCIGDGGGKHRLLQVGVG